MYEVKTENHCLYILKRCCYRGAFSALVAVSVKVQRSSWLPGAFCSSPLYMTLEHDGSPAVAYWPGWIQLESRYQQATSTLTSMFLITGKWKSGAIRTLPTAVHTDKQSNQTKRALVRELTRKPKLLRDAETIWIWQENKSITLDQTFVIEEVKQKPCPVWSSVFPLPWY